MLAMAARVLALRRDDHHPVAADRNPLAETWPLMSGRSAAYREDCCGTKGLGLTNAAGWSRGSGNALRRAMATTLIRPTL